MKLMIGLGITHTKSYCFADVVAALKQMRMPDSIERAGLLFVLNTEDSGFYQLYADVLYKLSISSMQRDVFPVPDDITNKVAVRNELIAAANQNNCDALLMLDADICVEPHTLEEMLECAVEHNADVVTVPYNITTPNGVALSVFLKNAEGVLGYVYKEACELPEHFKVDACGMGCILLSGEALNTPFRRTDKPEDLQWCEDFKGDIWVCGKESVRHRILLQENDEPI